MLLKRLFILATPLLIAACVTDRDANALFRKVRLMAGLLLRRIAPAAMRWKTEFRQTRMRPAFAERPKDCRIGQ